MLRVVVMGVAGAGKTTVGTELAECLGVTYLDADAVHPQANIDKMASGEPLDDADRAPWLVMLRDTLATSENIVVTCSALKRRYRDVLREAGDVRFVYLRLEESVAEQRVASRPGHFMKAGMMSSQFDALEPPSADEADVIEVDATLPLMKLVDDVVRALQPW